MARERCSRFFNKVIQLPREYEAIEPVGQGAFGVVFSARESRGEGSYGFVAVKKIEVPFLNSTTARSVLREVCVLTRLKHPNIVGLERLIVGESALMSPVYLILELLETDLGSVLKSQQVLSTTQIRFIFIQLIDALTFIHSQGIIHRDIKPRNLLMSANCDVKICDFGLARKQSDTARMTEYVCTRWYRAPEIILDSPSHDEKVDIFSAGCLLGELVTSRPLFPGADAHDQLRLIFERFGPPETEDVYAVVPPGTIREYITKLSMLARPGGDIHSVLSSKRNPIKSGSLVHCIKDMCCINPHKRPHAADIERFEWLNVFLPQGRPPMSTIRIADTEDVSVQGILCQMRKEATLLNDARHIH